MSVFQGLSLGNMVQPPRFGLVGEPLVEVPEPPAPVVVSLEPPEPPEPPLPPLVAALVGPLEVVVCVLLLPPAPVGPLPPDPPAESVPEASLSSEPQPASARVETKHTTLPMITEKRMRSRCAHHERRARAL